MLTLWRVCITGGDDVGMDTVENPEAVVHMNSKYNTVGRTLVEMLVTASRFSLIFSRIRSTLQLILSSINAFHCSRESLYFLASQTF